MIRLTNYAIESGIISVAVYQTPNQPITFVDEPLPLIYQNGRSEDGIIARTWSMFKEDPTEPDVLLRLPMTKGVVKCLDTVEVFLQENLNMPKASFKYFLVGGSYKPIRGQLWGIDLKIDKAH